MSPLSQRALDGNDSYTCTRTHTRIELPVKFSHSPICGNLPNWMHLVHDSWVFHGVAWSLINYRWNANENQFQLLFIEVMFNRWSYRQNICIQLNLTHVQLFFVPPCPSRLRHVTNTISHTKIIVFIENGKYQINASQRSMVNKYRAFIRNHVTRPTYVCAK